MFASPPGQLPSDPVTSTTPTLVLRPRWVALPEPANAIEVLLVKAAKPEYEARNGTCRAAAEAVPPEIAIGPVTSNVATNSGAITRILSPVTEVPSLQRKQATKRTRCTRRNRSACSGRRRRD